MAYERRPFVDLDDMEEQLVERFNSVVSPDDTTYHLGDFSFESKEGQRGTLERLNGKHLIVLGNHDRSKSFLSDIGFEILPGKGKAWIPHPNGRDVITLSHYPYRTSRHDDRDFREAMPLDTGGWLLHGHVHSCWRVSWEVNERAVQQPADRPKGLQINVGVDVWDYTPVSLDTLLDIIRRKEAAD